jgi:hypothetical protein
MARTLKTVEIGEDEENLETPPSENENAEASDVARLISELGGGNDANAKVSVWKVVKGERDAFCCTLTPLEFSLDHLARGFGGGTYRVRVYASNPTARSGVSIKYNQLINIAEPKNAEPAAMQSELSSIMQKFIEHSERQTQQLKESLENRNKGPSWVDAIKVVGPIVTPLLLEVLKRPAPVAPVQTSLTEQIMALKALQDLAGDMKEEKSDASPLVTAAAEFAKAFGTVVASNPHAMPHIPAVVSSTTTGQITPPQIPVQQANSAVPVPAQQKQEQDVMLKIRNVLNTVCDKFDASNPMPDIADYVDSQFSDEEYDALLNGLETDGWFAVLCSINERCVKYQSQFEALRNELLNPSTTASQVGTAESQ